ncbi:MAG: DUF975 family protein [Ruminococcus sp.]|nr:DUF975 family protein [Ruminococcus sp.]
MSTEKIIRSQAKKSLNGNWTAAVSGLFVLLAEVLLVAVFYSMLTGLTGIYEGEKLKSGSEPIVIIILVLTIIFAFALSPFENGFYRLCYNIAGDRSDGLRDVFYFFSGTKQYFKALQFNIFITLKKLLYTLIGFAPYIIFEIIKSLALGTNPGASLTQAFGIMEAVALAVCAVAAIIINIRIIIPKFVFVDNFEANVFDIARAISKKHLKEYYKLIATFIIWILSCMFVLPGLYVIPYMTTSLGTTSKWLINMYKEGKTV